MKSSVTPFVLGLVCLWTSPPVYAQKDNIYREQTHTWLASVALGTTRYTGDMNEPGDLSHLRLGTAVALSAGYRLSQRVVLRADAQLYYIHGRHQYTRIDYNNLSFHSLNPDVWAGVQVDWWPTSHRTVYRSPYLLAGLGLTYLSPRTDYGGQCYALAPRHTEGVAYNRLPGLVRYGLGIPLVSQKRWRLHLEGTYTHVMSDYLDDVSTVYADPAQLDPLTATLADRRAELGLPPNPAGAQRGNSTRNDGYFILSARGVYIIRTQWDRGYRDQMRGSSRRRRLW